MTAVLDSPAVPADVAGDIRDALAPLLNSVQLIRMVAGGNPRVDSSLGVIARQVERLAQLADTLGVPGGNGGDA